MAINDNIKFNLNQYNGAVPDRMKKDLISRGCSGALNDMYKCYKVATGRDYLKDMSLPVAPRVFITLDPVLQTHFLIQSPVVLAGDFRVSIESSLSTLTGNQAFFSDNLGVTVDLFRIDPTNGGLDVTINSVFFSDDGLLTADNKLNRVEFERIGTTLTKRYNGVAVGVNVVGSSAVIIGAVGRRAGATRDHFDGVLANVELTDLTTPSNSESWKLDRPFPQTTEQSSSGNNLLTYVNADSVTRELFTLIDGDWLGGELFANGGFDTDTDWIKDVGWTISGGFAEHAGAADSIRQTLNPIQGAIYRMEVDRVDNEAGGLNFVIGGTFYSTISGVGRKTITEASGAGTNIAFQGGAIYTLDNASVKRILEVA